MTVTGFGQVCRGDVGKACSVLWGSDGEGKVIVVLTAVDLPERNACPSREQVREAMSGNLCRCTGYHGIVDAVSRATSRVGGDAACPVPGLDASSRRAG